VADGRSGKFGPPLVVHRNAVVCGEERDGDEAPTRTHGIAFTSITTPNSRSIPLPTIRIRYNTFTRYPCLLPPTSA
jgi:hypothetical protein